MPNPTWAPAWLYVPMPEGSSSEAPVMSPGPSLARKPLSPFSAAFSALFFATALPLVRSVNEKSGLEFPCSFLRSVTPAPTVQRYDGMLTWRPQRSDHKGRDHGEDPCAAIKH